MTEISSMLSSGAPPRVILRPYAADLPLGTLAVGVDNIHHDVFLSPAFVETTEAHLLESIRQIANLAFLTSSDRLQNERRMQNDRRLQAKRRDAGKPVARAPEPPSWKKQLSELLHAGLQQAKYQKN